MATSDRTQYKQVLIGVLGALRTVSNSFLAVAQDAQRFDYAGVGNANTALATINFPLCRVDRPVLIKECRILPGGALTAGANFVQINFGYTNDVTNTITVLAGCNTNAANLDVGNFPSATGNWAFGASIKVAQNANQNQVVPSGSQLVWQSSNGTVGMAIPANTQFQGLWEEV